MPKLSRWDLGDKRTAELVGQLWTGFELLRNRNEIRRFLSKFFTPTEIQMFAKRLELLKLADSDLSVTQLFRSLGVAKVTVYEWLEKHDAYEKDFAILVDRLKYLDQEYLEKLKAAIEASENPSIIGGLRRSRKYFENS